MCPLKLARIKAVKPLRLSFALMSAPASSNDCKVSVDPLPAAFKRLVSDFLFLNSSGRSNKDRSEMTSAFLCWNAASQRRMWVWKRRWRPGPGGVTKRKWMGTPRLTPCCRRLFLSLSGARREHHSRLAPGASSASSPPASPFLFFFTGAFALPFWSLNPFQQAELSSPHSKPGHTSTTRNRRHA